jgi:hypothetical protein
LASNVGPRISLLLRCVRGEADRVVRIALGGQFSSVSG